MAVISAFGSGKGAAADNYYKSYLNLLENMEKAGVNRLIAVTGDGTHKDWNWFFKCFVKTTVYRTTFKDTEKTEDYFKTYIGPVQWTIVRPFRLYEGEKGRYRTALENEHPEGSRWGPGVFKSYTGDIAQFCFDEMSENKFVNKLVSTGI